MKKREQQNACIYKKPSGQKLVEIKGILAEAKPQPTEKAKHLYTEKGKLNFVDRNDTVRNCIDGQCRDGTDVEFVADVFPV